MRVSRTKLALSCLILVGPWGCADRDERPTVSDVPLAGIVLVTVDGLIGDELSVFGGPTPTPNLERIAAEGAAWSDAWTVCPLTRPAVTSYLTGLAPDHHAVLDDSRATLAEEVPTLATVLAERGYSTAAFPDSNHLSFASGLLRGFEIVDDPPVAPGGRVTWLPYARPAELGAANFASWLTELPAGESYFAWLHFSGPLLAQMLDAERESTLNRAEVVRRFDAALGEILSTVDSHVAPERSAIIVAGTLGDVSGGEIDLPGPGFSLAERAIRVPIVARLPGTFPSGESTPPWAPDVAVTLARLGGAGLSAVDGRDLQDDVATERPIFAWSRSPRDQMGWQSLSAVRLGRVKRLEGLVTRTLSLDGQAVTDAESKRLLARHLSERIVPGGPQVPLETIDPLLASRGIVTRPLPAEGRVIEPASLRREIVREVWKARRQLRSGRVEPAASSYARALELDPDNLASRIGLGEIQIARGSTATLKTLLPAVERYPRHPEVLHAYAHAIWLESWRQAEALLEAVLPFMPHDGDVLYDLACARSLAGDVSAAEDRLRAAIGAGYHEWPHIETDPDLRALRESGGLARVLRDHRR